MIFWWEIRMRSFSKNGTMMRKKECDYYKNENPSVKEISAPPLVRLSVDKHHHRKKISWSAQWWGRWWWGGSQWWGLSYDVSSRLHITASIQPSDCCLHSWGESGQEIDNVQRQQKLLPKVNISNWDLHPPSIFPPFALDQPTNQEVESH